MRRILRQLGRADGAEIIEAALVLPLLFMFLLGIVWFGRAFQIYSTMTQAAQRGAVAAARPSCATCPQPGDSWSGTNFPGDTTVSNAVYAITDASNLDRGLMTGNLPGSPFHAHGAGPDTDGELKCAACRKSVGGRRARRCWSLPLCCRCWWCSSSESTTSAALSTRSRRSVTRPRKARWSRARSP